MALSRRARILTALLFLAVAGRPADVSAQAAPPVDEAEGGGAAGSTELRIGPAVVSGAVWLDGSFPFDEGPEIDPGGFAIRRARVGVAGPLGDRISYGLTAELTQPALRNAFLIVRVDDHVSIRMGQANPIATLERGTSPLTLELIDRSAATNSLASRPDVGVTVFTTRPYGGRFGYALNVTNGTGPNEPDDNRHKDVLGRLAITPLGRPGLLIVASGARGRQPDGLRTRAGLGADYRTGAWHLLAEYLRQRRGERPTSHGYVVMAAYRHQPAGSQNDAGAIEVAGRFVSIRDRASSSGSFVDDEGALVTAGGTAREVQGGINYYFSSGVRLMGNVILPVDDRPDAAPRVHVRWQFQF